MTMSDDMMATGCSGDSVVVMLLGNDIMIATSKNDVTVMVRQLQQQR